MSSGSYFFGHSAHHFLSFMVILHSFFAKLRLATFIISLCDAGDFAVCGQRSFFFFLFSALYPILSKISLCVLLYFCPETKVPKVLHSKGGDDAGVEDFLPIVFSRLHRSYFPTSAHRREKSTLLFPLHFSRLCVDFSSFAVVAYLLTSRGAVRNGRKCRR